MRAAARRLAFGLSTLLGWKRRGFFIPYRYAADLPDAARRVSYAELEPVFAAAEPAFSSVLQCMDQYADALMAIGSEPPPAPRWDQDWFPRLDAAAAYVLVRERQPGNIIEVGSGHSTRFLCRAVRDGVLHTQMTAIDPAPRAAIEGLKVKLIPRTLQAAGADPFRALNPGDMLFIDSSHILMPGTDVDVLFNRILPGLPSGVLVHIHDVFLPDDYPPDWDWRGYNEQLGVATLLQGGNFMVLWSSHYAATRMAGAVTASLAGRLPLKPGAPEASLWLMKG
jgi:hypothetical protein